MLTVAQIDAETQDPLTDSQVVSLLNIVRRYKVYAMEQGKWPDLEGKLNTEQLTPTVKTQALKAVLTAVAKLPSLVVETNGTDTDRSYFSTRLNWEEAAIDILNILYKVPAVIGRTGIIAVRKTVKDLTQREDIYLTDRDTGRRY